MTPASPRPRPLDELIVTVVVDNETDTLSSVDPGLPQLPEMVGHVVRATPTTSEDGHTCVQVFDHLCVACHGFSALLSGRRGDETHSVLFDVGPDGEVWLANAERLAVDLAAIEAVFLSHWHWDHSGGLPVAVAAIADARRSAGRDGPLVVDVHPDRPDQRGVQAGSGTLVLLPPEPTLAELEEAGGRVVLHGDPHLLGGDFFLGSGAIPRVTAYETGLPGHHSFRDGRAQPDPLIMDERFLAAEVTGRGVTVLSACSHAGVVNAALAAGAQFDDAPVDVVLGGYHLAGQAMEDRIPATVRDLAERVRPRLVAPGHCTGWRAKTALAEQFAPGGYAPSVVGTTYVLTAPPTGS